MSLPTPPRRDAPAPGMARAGRWALYGGIALVCLLAFNPNGDRVPTLGPDKLQHAAAFMALTIAAWWAHPSARWRALAGLWAFGILIEFVQSGIPGRSAEFGDVVADMLGMLAGVLVMRFAARLRLG